jgi:hypothetical protein
VQAYGISGASDGSPSGLNALMPAVGYQLAFAKGLPRTVACCSKRGSPGGAAADREQDQEPEWLSGAADFCCFFCFGFIERLLFCCCIDIAVSWAIGVNGLAGCLSWKGQFSSRLRVLVSLHSGPRLFSNPWQTTSSVQISRCAVESSVLGENRRSR